MFKVYILFFLMLIQFTTWSTSKTMSLNGFRFSLEASIKTVDGDSVFSINLFRLDSLDKKHFLLSHITKEKIGDCNSEVLELGSCRYTDSTLLFYSFWCTTGDAPASPYGARKQTYNVNKVGALVLASSELYIETTKPEWSENIGIEFLFQTPKTEVEKREFQLYIKNVESAYNANFVYGINSDNLIKEVKKELKDEIYKETKYWDLNGAFGTRL